MMMIKLSVQLVESKLKEKPETLSVHIQRKCCAFWNMLAGTVNFEEEAKNWPNNEHSWTVIIKYTVQQI